MLRIRDAAKGDGATLLRFIRDLAAYEKLLDKVVATASDIETHITAPNPIAYALIAEENGSAVGMALYFYSFSTFRGRPGLYIEDIYVDPARRGAGIGHELLKALAAKAQARHCARMEWAVLDWNKPALSFYEKLGAVPLSDWIIYRLEGDALAALAAV